MSTQASHWLVHEVLGQMHRYHLNDSIIVVAYAYAWGDDGSVKNAGAKLLTMSHSTYTRASLKKLH